MRASHALNEGGPGAAFANWLDMDDDWNDRMDAYERKLSPFGKFVYRTERRIQRYDLRAKLAEAKARAVASRATAARKGRSRRRSGSAAPPSTSTPCSSAGEGTRD